MKKEDNYLDRLFEQAKTKPPQLSFEEVANRFETSVASTGSFTVLKNWIGNHLTLHSFIMLTTISSILTVIYLIFAPSNLTDSIPETTQRLTQVESTDIPSTTVIAKEKTESQSKAITLQNSWKESIQPIEKSPNLKTAITERNNTSIASDLALTTTTLNRKEEVVKLPTTQFPNTIESLATNAQLPPIKIQSDSIRKYINGENTISTLDSFPLNPSNRSNAGFGYTINTDERKWQEKTKTFQKEFDLSANGSSKIINEFGKVQIKPWKLNKAKIKVTVSVSGHKPAKIQQVFEHLNIHFSQQGEQIIAKTEVRNRKKISWNNRKNWKVRIDYEVYIPERSSIDIDHYHGELEIGKLKGKVNLALNYVDFSAKSIGSHSTINMSNGKGKIENGGHLFSRLHFAEISAGKLGTLELAVNNSSFQAETAKDVLGKSYYTDLIFGTIENYDINGHGGKVDIQKAKKIKMKHINLEMSLGDAESISAKLNHSQVQSKKVGSISMDLLNTDFKVAEAKSVIGKSQWGQLDIGTIERYDNNSHGTKVNIDKVNLVKAKGWSTELSIKEVVQSLEVDFDLGKCDATISSHAPHINLVGKNAHFDLIIPTQAKFQFGIKSNAKNYSYPKDLQVHQQIPKATHHEEQGYYRDSTATNWLKAHLQWGTLQLNKVSRK